MALSGISVDGGRRALEEAGETVGALDIGVMCFGGGYAGIIAPKEVEARYFDVE